MRSSSATGFSAVVLMVGLLAVVVLAGKRGLADVVAQDPKFEIERWRAGKFVMDPIRLNVIQAELHKALELDPKNPNLLEELGRFYAVRVERRQPSDMNVREIRQQSLTFFRQLLELRPTSGHAYVNVALMKFWLGEIDQEFSQSLRQALHRSPWEPQVQLITIELGLASWPALSDSGRQAIQRAIRSQGEWKLVNQQPSLLSLLKRYNRPDLGCLLGGEQKPCGAS